MRLPTRVTIETVFGCNARCVMCPIDFPTQRQRQIMPPALFESLVATLAPHAAQIGKFDLFGLGEPLLDPWLFDRIRLAKQAGFPSVGISTNAHLLTPEKQVPLLDSGLDVVIFSIDGIDKATHESIRRRVNFDRVIDNCLNTIRRRDELNRPTRFVVRFIRQPKNYTQWEAFRQFWLSVISPQRGDFITLYDMHSWGGKVATKAEILAGHLGRPEIETQACHHLDNLIILSDGSIPLCSEDWLDSPFRLGNVQDSSPLELFNSPKFNRIRAVHAAGRKNRLPLCRECTVLYSETTRLVVTAADQTDQPFQHPDQARALPDRSESA